MKNLKSIKNMKLDELYELQAKLSEKVLNFPDADDFSKLDLLSKKLENVSIEIESRADLFI